MADMESEVKPAAEPEVEKKAVPTYGLVKV
jgi:hypothetical protein